MHEATQDSIPFPAGHVVTSPSRDLLTQIVSTGDFAEALQALLDPDCRGLSATTVTRLVSQWQDEHYDWSQRDLSDEPYVYVWADGIQFNIRLEEDHQCILVLMGATADGRKELIAVQDDHRESEQSWMTMLLELKHRCDHRGPSGL